MPRDCAQPKGGATWKGLIDRAYAHRKWRKADPRTALQKKRIARHRHCAWRKRTKNWMIRSARNHRRSFKAYRRSRRSDCIAGVTIYRIGSQCIAIPAYIVACESGGSWSAYNPSGAASIYQIMPMHGRPWPVDSVEDKRAHHRIAHRLYAGGSGAGNWVCA